jgi:antitoxin component YwqK of YwqJK toxin-antitoxin module
MRQASAVSLAVATALAVAFCADSPCPRGQELREEWHAPNRIKARGCVARTIGNSDRLEGRWVYHYPTGEKMAEGAYRSADAGGEMGRTGVLRHGREGLWVFYHKNGQKDWEVSYRQGKADGPFAAWYSNGQKRLEGDYRGGKREGPWVMWNEYGQKQQEALFVDDRLVAGSQKMWVDANPYREASATR